MPKRRGGSLYREPQRLSEDAKTQGRKHSVLRARDDTEKLGHEWSIIGLLRVCKDTYREDARCYARYVYCARYADATDKALTASVVEALARRRVHRGAGRRLSERGRCKE